MAKRGRKPVTGGQAPAPLDELLAAIASPDLRAIAAHWREVRGALMMPSWRTLQPSAMKGQLPILWAFRYDRETGQFVGRLAGSKITQMFDKSFAGAPMEEIIPPEVFDWANNLFRRVVQEPAVYWGSGRVFRYLGRHGLGERIVLPLSDDGILADGVLGATEYHYPGTGLGSADTEIEKWACLRPQRTRK